MTIRCNNILSKPLILILLLVTPLMAQAQDDSRIYEATEAYEFGRFEEVDSLLRDVVGTLKGEALVNAYRLLALSCINMDKPQEAEDYVGKLLTADPYFKAFNESPRFADMVERMKKGKTNTISTASQQAETIEEAPVPVTLITEDMIKMCGARTLKDVMLAYVPGMSNIESNEEMNIAMRGVSSSRQEKILIMLNGHRLNGYSTNSAAPDYSISLEKVKQIEVLRGPASSLYGGVALTAVVNIITKDGGEVDGLTLKMGGGNYGQIKGNMLFGKRYVNLSVLAWANIYKSDGQKFFVKADEQPNALQPLDGNIRIGAYNHQPAHDLGFAIQWQDFTFTYNNMFAKTVAPYSMSVLFTAYDYPRYGTFSGNKPGYAVTTNNLEAKYDKSFGIWGLQACINYDLGTQQLYQVAGDDISWLGIEMVPYGTDVSIPVMTGAFQDHKWRESTLSGHLQGRVAKKINDHDISSLIGGHVGRLFISDSYYAEGVDYTRILKVWDEYEKNLIPNHEVNADLYFQTKYKWKDHFIVNAGLRYDYKNRYNYMEQKHEDINVLSPRAALIVDMPTWATKFSYAKSFVDAPYFYRNSKLDTSWGALLDPEYLHSLQASFISKNMLKGLTGELNLFYNSYENVIVNEILVGAYLNGGLQKSIGTELTLRYQRNKFHGEANMTWQKLVKTENLFDEREHTMRSTPELMANLLVQYEALKNLNLHTHLRYTSRQYQACVVNYETYESEFYESPARLIVNLGANYSFKNLELGGNVYNLFNTKYYQGGQTTGLIRQPGLWFMADVSYKF